MNNERLTLEIERLEEELEWWVNLVETRSIGTTVRPSLKAYVNELEARVRELTMLESYHRRILDVLGYENPIVDFTTPTVLEKVQDLQARFAQVEQERDRLREQYNKVLGAIDEGLVEDDATLAAASVTEMRATINRLRDENTDLQHRVTRYDAEMRELVRLRGLIRALEAAARAVDGAWSVDPTQPLPVYMDCIDTDRLLRLREALAALLRERQTI